MSEIDRRLAIFETRMARLPWAASALLLLCLALAKQGLTYVQMFEDRYFTETPAALELPHLLLSRSLLVTRIFHIETRLSYAFFSFVLCALTLLTIAWLLRRRLPKMPALTAFAAIALGQIGLMTFGQFGRADTWFILGAALLMLSGNNSWPVWVVGSLIMSLANPGQSLMAVLLFCPLLFTLRFRIFRPRIFTAAAIATLWMVIVLTQQTGNQVTSFGAYWSTGVNGFLISGPLRIYSIYGILWLGVIGLLLSARGRLLAIYLASLVVAPIAIVIVTGDGTRVGVGVSLLSLLALIIVGAPVVNSWFQQRLGPYHFTGLLLLLVVAPTLNLYEFDAVMPWEWVKFSLGDWFITLISR